MEKSWENFWTTGKVEDYLSYRNGVTDKDEKTELGGKINESTVEDKECKSQEGLRSTWDSR